MTFPAPNTADLTGPLLASVIDHTLLKPEATPGDIARLCEEAVRHQFKAVCVNALYLPEVARRLAGSAVAACAVIGFPLGAMPTEVKVAETRWVVAHGAQEVDMVIPVGLLKAGQLDAVRADIAAVKAACGDALLKVIIEACLLTDAEKVAACRLSAEAGADYVKTSTGFSSGGATVADVALMRQTVGDALGVKASGGIRTRETALEMVEAGASRIGASAGVSFL
ncbi:deoxyribose-phosphate aldolase [Novispirillum itersonii]|uniref:Deoxyribose-phosphate aldolase n=1 Tax=Novispirillum itersonii TaxID=189 RepID=A0A7W9ZHY9_NOVIT|nr:deoxyribose-phosphate aldolase [Novispirillum itersonii]MBB6211837.1 deoxyribose-phosphate aldolase [Novispirillum itersonii]